MKPSQPIENRLQSTGTTLRDRPSVIDQVMAEIKRRVATGMPRPQTDARR